MLRSKLHVNGCICNRRAVICTILSQISDAQRFFSLLLFYRLFCTSLPQERGSSQRACVKVLAGVWERQSGIMPLLPHLCPSTKW